MPLHLVRRFSLRLSCFALVGIALMACSKPEAVAPPVRAVKLVTVGPSSQQSAIQYAGAVTARTETALGFRVAGKLLSRPVEQGQSVHKGQLLAQLDATDYQLSAAAAQAQLRAATTERDLQQADLKRFQELRAQNFISAAELDRRTAGLKAAESRVAEAQAQMAAQGNQTQYTKLEADADAIVIATLAEPGQVVAAGTPVVRLALDGARDVSFAVPEQRVAQVQAGQQVTVRAWAANQAPQAARVREIAASADPATRTFAVKVEILGESQPPLGATVTVDWPVANTTANSIRLPGTAIWQDPKGQSAVWVFDSNDQTVQARTIDIARADGNEWVVQSGLQVGERVVAAGVHVLQAGEKVSVFKGDIPDTPAAMNKTDTNAGANAANTARGQP
ncbi:efflux RND transporter periplasmic adaptor subunit [Lampropedia puyangensis]|uniref:Efflux RND transporter periplasmic adaptor subunit n=2 Tax=Lampropedia puyangensis TaxID=1330072 RepID=A0A4S8F1N9_9BURK|nr:efflux RND transporter periplasmic adaptor subunit [Lampropedia puyangensis]